LIHFNSRLSQSGSIFLGIVVANF